MELNNDVKSQLLNGVPIYVNGVGNVYPLTMQEISRCMESKYYSVVGFISKSLNDLEEVKEGATYFDYFIYTCISKEEIRRNVEFILSKVLKEQVSLDAKNFCFYIGDKLKPVDADKVRLIDKETFDGFADVIRWQNCIEKTSQKKVTKNKNSKIEMLKKKRAKGRSLLIEAKGEDFSMTDIQSTLGIFYRDIDKVTKMTVYQVNDQYQKFMRKEKYDKQYSTYLAGADPKKLELNIHWSAKQKSKDMDNVAPPS